LPDQAAFLEIRSDHPVAQPSIIFLYYHDEIVEAHPLDDHHVGKQ